MTSILKAPPVQREAFLLKKSQLFSKKDFTQLFSVSTKKHGRHFTLYYQTAPEAQPAMLGSVISKKNARTSVQRNLIKRLVREHFRLNQHELNAKQVLIMAKKGVNRATRAELSQDLQQLFSFLKDLS